MSMPKPPLSDDQPDYLITPHVAGSFSYLGVCPYASTYTAHSLTHDAEIMFILPCRRWSCRLCAEQKIRRLANAVRLGTPNRLLTLTVDPPRHADPEAAWNETRRQVPILIRKLRDQFGEVEYMRVTEITKNGWPHYHLLVRSGYLPHSVIKGHWSSMTGARIVDIRQVKRAFSAYHYLVKYLSKLHRLDWTDRHVSLSKHFAPVETDRPNEPIEHAAGALDHSHPAYVMLDRYQGWTAKRLSKHAHLLHPPDKSCGIAPERPQFAPSQHPPGKLGS